MLYEVITGEFYMVLFDNVVVDGEVCNALGIFKSENKDTFLKVYLKDQNFELGSQQGINIKKLDKGCIIFNTEESVITSYSIHYTKLYDRSSTDFEIESELHIQSYLHQSLPSEPNYERQPG